MRRFPAVALAAMATLALVGCSAPHLWNETPAKGDVLFLRTAAGITLVNTVSEAHAVRLSGAIPSTDWSAVVQAVRDGETTHVQAIDPISGRTLWSRDAAGRLEVKVASADGRVVALGKPDRARTGYPRGRSMTTLTVIDQETSEPRTFELAGNYEPEAFSTDGQSLFVIEYLPPEDPSSYRVRRLDLRTERVVGVYSVDAHLQEAMQGTARIQAASPDGRRLYTLYTIKADGSRHAFVHVLSLDELWAHCVDLPASFASASERSIALAVAPDGKRFFAADGSTGKITEVDTEALKITRTTVAGFHSASGAAHAVTAPDGMLYVAKGRELVALHSSTLAPVRSWNLEDDITGLQTGTIGHRLYVGLKDHILMLDTETGESLGTFDPYRVDSIRQLGRSTRPVAKNRQNIVCAC
jgi:DNA-binding beta-propeller fold protein YncE